MVIPSFETFVMIIIGITILAIIMPYIKIIPVPIRRGMILIGITAIVLYGISLYNSYTPSHKLHRMSKQTQEMELKEFPELKMESKLNDARTSLKEHSTELFGQSLNN